MSDLYSVLGLASTATKEEIKKAYRSLSLKFHPDKTGGNLDAITKFQKISEAYETLGDEQRKAEYDFMGKNQSMRMGGCQEMPFQDMEDILSAIFGGGGGGGPMFGGGGPFGGNMGPKIHVFRAGGGGGGPGGMPNMFFEHASQKPTPIIKTITITMYVVL